MAVVGGDWTTYSKEIFHVVPAGAYVLVAYRGRKICAIATSNASFERGGTACIHHIARNQLVGTLLGRGINGKTLKLSRQVCTGGTCCELNRKPREAANNTCCRHPYKRCFELAPEYLFSSTDTRSLLDTAFCLSCLMFTSHLGRRKYEGTYSHSSSLPAPDLWQCAPFCIGENSESHSSIDMSFRAVFLQVHHHSSLSMSAGVELHGSYVEGPRFYVASVRLFLSRKTNHAFVVEKNGARKQNFDQRQRANAGLRTTNETNARHVPV